MASTPVRDQLAVAATGVTRFGLRSESLGVAEIRLPPIAMQRVVVEHLDAETSRIDALIVRKRRMIELLHEREASAREDMVSRLASTEVVTRPVKRLVIEVDERLGGREPLALLSVSIHLGVVPRASMTDKEPRAEELMNYKVCQVGDIVLNRMRAFQGGVGCAMVSGIVSPDYTVLRPVKMNSEFLGHLFRSPWFVGEMTARLRGIGNSEQGNVRTPRINFAELGLIEIPVPPLKVQAEIAADLDGTVGHSMGLGNRLFRQIDLLVEHRQALITAAVTGQLDIPGLAA
jgi:type I restriction enzyme S subunit